MKIATFEFAQKQAENQNAIYGALPPGWAPRPPRSRRGGRGGGTEELEFFFLMLRNPRHATAADDYF